MSTDRPETLRRLIHLIDVSIEKALADLGPRPDFNIEHSGTYFAWRRREQAAYRGIVQHLVDHHGGRFTERPPDGNALKLAGIRTTCTSGPAGLLRNWQNAARRRLGEASL